MDHDCDLIEAPDTCFKCKMRYMRAHGVKVHWQGGVGRTGRDFFHDSCIAERQRRIVADARANGWEARPVNPLYDRPANFTPKAAANG